MINLTFIHKIFKRDFKKIFMTFLLCFIAPAAWAEGPYYIKNGGNDKAAGTSDDTAWATLANVDNTHFSDGTDIYFKQGDTWTITSAIDINHSGVDRNNRAIIGCYEDTGDFECSGSRPIIQNSTEDGFVFWFHDSGYLTFNYLDIRSSHANWKNSNSSGLFSGSDGSGGNHKNGYMHITNCRFYHLGHFSLHLGQMGDYNIITGNTFESVGNAVYFIDEVNDGSNYNYVADNTCKDIVGYYKNGTVQDGHCVSFQRGEYNIVENNTSTDAHNGAFNLFTSGSAYPLRYNVFRNNTSIRTNGAGLNFASDGNRKGDTISTGNLAYGNIIVEPNADDARNRPGLLISSLKPATGSNKVFNNTVYKSHTMGLSARYGSDNVHFINNIVVGDGRTSGSDMLFSFQSDRYPMGRSFTVEKNLYWTTLGDPSSYSIWNDSEGGGLKNWATWSSSWSTTGPSPADPLFNDAVNNDFTLTGSSPAINAGTYLTHVTTASSGTTITVDDTYWFHGDFGLDDADGNPIDGMEITFYDETYGLQHRIITSDFINHGTPGTFVVDRSIKSIYNAAHLYDPKYTTQVSLRFFGTKPDIGAKEYNSSFKMKQSVSFPSGFRIVQKNNQ